MTSLPPAFSPARRADLLELLAWRRDVRCFRREPLPAGTVDRLVACACLAPSVGLSEPWRFVLVEEAYRRAAVRANFAAANAAALASQAPERRAAYARLKLAGLDDAPVQIAAFADPGGAAGDAAGEAAGGRQGHGLGRATMPETVDLSVAIAIHTMWLAARAEGIGLGWVSILDPRPLNALLDVPAHWRLTGYLCLGYPETEDDRPLLARAGWDERRDPACRLFRR